MANPSRRIPNGISVLRDESFPAYPHSGDCDNCGRPRDDLFYHRQDDAFYCCDVFRCEARAEIIATKKHLEIWKTAMTERSPRMGIGGLKPGLSGPPLDCNNSCMDGECSCSGNWRVLAYDAEGVEALVAAFDRLIEVSAQYLDTGRGDLDGAIDLARRMRTGDGVTRG